MSTPRPTRSRVSSPYVGAPPVQTNESQNSNGGKSERPRTFMDKWVEPPLPAPRPSFAEAGIERHGVVQNMAPLGTRPSSKMMKAVTARLENEGLGRSSTKRATASTATTPGESTMTPEPFATPLPIQAERSETPEVPTAAKASEEVASPSSLSRSSVPPPYNGQGAVAVQNSSPVSTPTGATRFNDIPLPPNQVSHALSASQTAVVRAPSIARSPHSTPAPHAQTPSQYTVPIHQSPYAPASTPTPSTLTPLVVPPLPMDDDGLPSINLELTDKIVESAVQDAVDQFKWPTAYALRTLYDDHRKNKRIVRLIEAVYNGRATDRDYQEFNIIMKQKKKEGKKGRTGEYYFNGDGSDPAPAQHIYSSAISVVNPPALPYKTPYSAVPPRPSTANSAATDPQARASSLNPASTSASPRKESEQADQHIDKRQRTSNMLPSLKLNGNTEAGADETKMSQSPGANGALKSTPRRPRSHSVASSTSSLSSVDEKLLGEGVLSAGVSPARPVSSRLPPGSIGLGFLVDQAAKPYSASPYASASSFAAVASGASVVAGSSLAGGLGSGSAIGAGAGAFGGNGTSGGGASVAEKLTLVHHRKKKKTKGNKHQQRALPSPITGQANSAPKPLFSTATPATPATPSSSASTLNSTSTNTGHSNSNKENHHTSASLAATRMAPSVLQSQESHSSEDLPVISQAPVKSLKASKSQAPIIVENEEVRKRKREARERSNKYVGRKESFVRTGLRSGSAPAVQEPESGSDAESSAAPPKKKLAKINLIVSNNNSKPGVSRPYHTRNHQEEEPDSSPTTLGFRPDVAPGSVNTSRAGTPQQLQRSVITRKTKPTGSGLRLKSSPKKKNGTSAGMPKENDPPSPTGVGANDIEIQMDNNDYCSACSGTGDLLCCDGCTRSFHFICVDPPLDEETMPLDFYCNKCQSASHIPWRWRPKIFDRMQAQLDETNPCSFQLPKDIREYFTDVQTGPEGEYEEVQPPPPPKVTKKNAEDSNIDFFRKKDSKGNTILCHSCHLSASAPDRMIIPCSFCGLNWHLDCLPTPLAKDPNPLSKWRCPAHINDLLATLPQFLGPAHRFRTIKGAPIEIPVFSRGFKNTGHIEIENDDTDVEDEPGFFETREFGKNYKLPAKGIVLDFISKVKQQGGGYVPSRFGARADHAKTLKNRADVWQSVTDSLSHNWTKTDLHKKQAALNLAAMAASSGEPAGASNVDMLVDALLSQAPPAAIALIGRGDAPTLAGSGKLSQAEVVSLQLLRDRIDGRLDADYKDKGNVATVETLSDPVTIPDGADTIMSTEGNEPVSIAEKPVEAEREPEIQS